jgi:hypothetical protein
MISSHTYVVGANFPVIVVLDKLRIVCAAAPGGRGLIPVIRAPLICLLVVGTVIFH